MFAACTCQCASTSGTVTPELLSDSISLAVNYTSRRSATLIYSWMYTSECANSEVVLHKYCRPHLSAHIRSE